MTIMTSSGKNTQRYPKPWFWGVIASTVWWFGTTQIGNFLGRNAPEGPIPAPWDLVLLLLWVIMIFVLVIYLTRRWQGFWKGFFGTFALVLAWHLLQNIL